ncbi:MAG TPA: hypothetical protein VIS29_08665 [Streptomyces sp.]|jgi:hypothetical protein
MLTQDELHSKYSDWRIWQTRVGRWWAWQKVTLRQLHADCEGALNADDIEGLAEQLQEQACKRAGVAK